MLILRPSSHQTQVSANLQQSLDLDTIYDPPLTSYKIALLRISGSSSMSKHIKIVVHVGAAVAYTYELKKHINYK